jgi:drug/metabolite transporter (DMT)-like permease
LLEATLLALGSAFLHAGWNLLVKTSGERFLTAWGQFLVGGICFLPVLLVTGLPPADAVPFLVASSLVHVVYVGALVRAYHHGDFSFAYPLARGGGALLAAIGGVAFLGDYLSVPSWLSIAIVVAGLASLVRPSVGMLAIGWSLLTALTIGTYTTIDAAGARRSDSGFGYGVLVVLGVSVALSVAGVARGRGRDLVVHLRTTDRWRVLAGGLASVLAYSMVLAAVRFAPVGYVAALRESSVVLGAALGWLLLRERLGRARLASSLVVAAGLVALIATR